jgi:PilZ domain
MYQECRCAHRYAFVAHAEVADSYGERMARVEDLSIVGAYLAMTNPFSKDTSILVKVRTQTEFFQCHAIVTHSTHGIGMGVRFRDISPPFLHVLQRWLLAAIHEQGNSLYKSSAK